MTITSVPLREAFVDAGAVRTHYWEDGEGDPLVLVHGGGAGADALGNWARCFPAFSRRFRTVAYDMVGFGQTVPPGPDSPLSQDARIDHLRDFLDALGLARVSLVGNSMGGATALGLAMRDPGRVSSLTLMGSAGLTRAFSPALTTILDYREPSLQGMRDIVGALTHEGFEAGDGLIEYRYRLTQDERVMRAYRSTMSWIRHRGGLFYDEADIAAVKTRTLVVSGREDAVVPLALSVRFHQLLDNSWLFAIPHCGHWAMLEQPDALTRAVIGFIDEEER